MTRTVAIARDFPVVLDAVFAQADIGTFTNDAVADVIGPIVIAVNVVGLVTAIALAVPRLRSHRTAFWIPLVVGVACLLVTMGLTLATAVSDPAFAAKLAAS